MLVLTRKRLESIAIGDDIRITVVKLERNQVRLGIEAPDDFMVLREELLYPQEREDDGPDAPPAGRSVTTCAGEDE